MRLLALRSPPESPEVCRYLGISCTGRIYAVVRAFKGQERPANSSRGDATKELSYQDTDAACYTGHLLHREELRRCPPHSRGPQSTGQARHFLQKGDATKELSYQATDTARYTSLIPGHLLHRGGLRRCSLHSRTGKASSFLQKGDATQELSYQATDAARSTTSRTEKPTRYSSKVTPQRSSRTRPETQFALLLLAL